MGCGALQLLGSNDAIVIDREPHDWPSAAASASKQAILIAGCCRPRGWFDVDGRR